ncbi:Protein transport protein SEC23 [Capsicum baccatum]|uniref:Protein transport protein SEC23 n=1 Tax=Capsicum baccatum TaxID=33114 RepID=A0A2G2WXD5_CAPBA|nr:Protein transport protein SEC23 [Capsicum baccatum]
MFHGELELSSEQDSIPNTFGIAFGTEGHLKLFDWAIFIISFKLSMAMMNRKRDSGSLALVLFEKKRIQQAMLGHRPLRATGVAVSFAVELLEGCWVSAGSPIMIFTSGATTICPGMIISSDFGNAIRNQRDVVGAAELRAPVESSGGFMMFENDATIEIVTKKHVKICGALGSRVSIQKKNGSVSVTEKLAREEAAASVMARLAVHRAESNFSQDVVRWLNKHLIRFASKFGGYVPGDPSSFRLATSLSLFPQFMYYLRRSQFVDVNSCTPDETAFFRLLLNREGVVGSLIMVQPTLFQYSFDGPPIPVLLDICSISPDSTLL